MDWACIHMVFWCVSLICVWDFVDCNVVSLGWFSGLNLVFFSG